MIRLSATILVALTIASTLSTSASAYYCLARSTNGATGYAVRAILARAQAVALRTCAAAGGNVRGVCMIAGCRP
jgi:hypothetical protein